MYCIGGGEDEGGRRLASSSEGWVQATDAAAAVAVALLLLRGEQLFNIIVEGENGKGGAAAARMGHEPYTCAG